MHSKIRTTFIGTQESVYGDSPAGKLERTSLVRTMFVPLQQGFYSDSKACFSVGIDQLSALAPEHGIVGAVSFPNSTAVGTPFACMPTVHDIQMNIIVKTPLFKDLPEFAEWNPHGFPVKVFPFGFKPLEVLNSDIGIIPNRKLNDFPSHLTKVGINEIPFFFSDNFKVFESLIGLEQSLPCHYFFAPDPDMFAEICLMQNFAIRGNNADSESFGIDVNAKYITPVWDFLFFAKESDNLQVTGQAEGLAHPAVFNEGLKPLIVSVSFDWNRCPVSWIHSKIDKEIGLGFKGFAISGDIELDGQAVSLAGFSFPRIPYEGTSYLNIKRGGFFAN
jgi:hypothetical protein